MRFAFLLAAALLGGCGLTLDLDPPDRPGIDGGARDGGEDAGSRPDGGANPCRGEPDGTVCDEAGRICLAEQCVRSRCGDGFVHAASGEECEDGNALSGDGCEPSCQHTCDSNSDCGASDPRCAAATCNAEHVCTTAFVPDDTSCVFDDDPNLGRCRSGRCVPATCGDGIVDTAAGEECDNDTAGDGCAPDCTLICHADTGCSDGVACNGSERCETGRRGDGQMFAKCLPAESPPALTPCFYCDLVTGIEQLARDEDGDGFSSLSGCANGQDCDDTDPTIHPGAPDFMSGDGVDNDCDGRIDEDLITTCYRDADGDGFGVTEGAVPVTADVACPAGTVPAGTTMAVDCDDADHDVFPGQSAWFTTSRCATGMTLPPGGLCWDYNCDGVEQQRWPRPASCLAILDRTCNDQGWSLLDGVLVPQCGMAGAWTQCASVLGLGCLPGAAISRPVQECH